MFSEKLKPLWRFTVGACTQQGLDILEESVFRTIKCLGEDNWDWAICHNGLTENQVDFIENFVRNRPINIVQQTWNDVPIPDTCWSPIKEDGTIEVDGRQTGGTLWKVCPARMRLNTHEVIMDNDIVLLKKPRVIDEFLASNKTLLLDEPIRFYGRYEYLFPFEERLNSGLMGMFPGFDFGKEIYRIWEQSGRLNKLTQADEQGLLCFSLLCQPNLRIKRTEIVEPLAADEPRILGHEFGFHFVQSNRTYCHRSWLHYKKIIQESIKFV